MSVDNFTENKADSTHLIISVMKLALTRGCRSVQPRKIAMTAMDSVEAMQKILGTSGDAREGSSAFLQKRDPVFRVA
jgi:enoyl-CoA hydratase/carnithine racemase